MPLVVGVIVLVSAVTAVVGMIGYVVDRSTARRERQRIERGE
jgi:uncharacterized membrane protein YsdA (DUF1294 family)